MESTKDTGKPERTGERENKMENAEIRLNGSEKQIAWATDIINGARECIARGIEHHTLGGGISVSTGEHRKQLDDDLWIDCFD